MLAWDPPNRLVLAWQLNVEFKYDPALITEVEVKFTPLSATSTRVDFEHRNLDRFGKPEVTKEMDGGWGQILDSFATTVGA